MKRGIVWGMLLIGTTWAAADDPAAPREFSTQDLDFFEKRVRPVLVQRCFECHSSKTEKLKGGLLLDNRDAILSGGDSGPAAIPGDTEKSLLIQALRYDSDSVQMPPAGKLPDAEVAVLTEWVRRGLPFPKSNGPVSARKSIDIAEGKKHWAFQPLPKIASVASALGETPLLRGPTDSSRTRIDDFIRAAQQKRGLEPSPQTSRRVLIRRLKFDLLGLPPSPDEVHEFVADDAPDAYERLVERYLASPQYGERWGRLWLDLARYADVLEQWRTEPAQAWLYRDWIVRAFNEDLPYDGFVRKQFAADLLADFQPQDSAALGYLGLSPSYWKELKLDHTVIKQVVAEEWEERIEAIGGTFLGLTLGCARCHDHKFDPVTQHDYYGLAGVLASIKLEDRPIIRSDLAAAAAAARAKIKELQEQAKKLEAERAAQERDGKPAAEIAVTGQRLAEVKTQIEQLRQTPHLDTPSAFAVTEASLLVLPDGKDRTKLEYKPNEPQNVALQIRGNAANAGPIVPRRFLSVLSPGEPVPFQSGSGRLELANAILSDAAPLASRVFVNRIWTAHFGRGLVTTPSNFGTQGEKPSHPELLDDLAARFIAHGWSLKWLHREIVLSATYRQTSGKPSTASGELADTDSPLATRHSSHSLDPDNVWLTRMPMRKLDVESWRDAMLATTGELHTSFGGAPLDLNDNNNHRRTLYGNIKRRELADILRLHDFPDPIAHNAARIPTTTPLQQLFVLNSSFLQARAAALATRTVGQHPQDPATQIRRAYQWLFQRDAGDAELQVGLQFLTASQSEGLVPELAWRQYAQALLAANEFQFVE